MKLYRQLAALAVIVATLFLSSCCQPQPAKKTFGLCLVSVENINADFKDTIRKLAAAGVSRIELMNYFGGGQYGMTAEELRTFLDENGISVLSSNTMGGSVDVENEEEYLARWDALLKEHKVLGAKYVSMTANLYWGGIDRVEKICQTLNKIGKMADGYGIRFIYHLHNIEYSTILDTDIRAVDYMMEHTDPAYVNFQFDTFWAVQGGVDPVAFMKEHADRIPCLHFKDYYELSDDSETFQGGYQPLFDTFYQYCGEDVILDMEPYMTREEMQAKVVMHAGITHSQTPWPTPRPGAGPRPRPAGPDPARQDSLDQARLKSLDAVLANIRFLQSKDYVK